MLARVVTKIRAQEALIMPPRVLMRPLQEQRRLVRVRRRRVAKEQRILLGRQKKLVQKRPREQKELRRQSLRAQRILQGEPTTLEVQNWLVLKILLEEQN